MTCRSISPCMCLLYFFVIVIGAASLATAGAWVLILIPVSLVSCCGYCLIGFMVGGRRRVLDRINKKLKAEKEIAAEKKKKKEEDGEEKKEEVSAAAKACVKLIERHRMVKHGLNHGGIVLHEMSDLQLPVRKDRGSLALRHPLHPLLSILPGLPSWRFLLFPVRRDLPGPTRRNYGSTRRTTVRIISQGRVSKHRPGETPATV